MWPDTGPAGIVRFGVFCRYLENAEEERLMLEASSRVARVDAKTFTPRAFPAEVITPLRTALTR